MPHFFLFSVISAVLGIVVLLRVRRSGTRGKTKAILLFGLTLVCLMLGFWMPAMWSHDAIVFWVAASLGAMALGEICDEIVLIKREWANRP